MKLFGVIIPKRFISLVVVLFLVFLFWFAHKSQATQPIYSCTQAHAEGIHDIKKGDKNYSRSLDRDGDGVACEL